MLSSRATKSEHINAIKNLSLHSEPSSSPSKNNTSPLYHNTSPTLPNLPSRETSGDQPILHNNPIHTKRTKQHGMDVERLKFLLRSNKRYNTRTLYEDYNKGLVIQNLYSIHIHLCSRDSFFDAVPFFFERNFKKHRFNIPLFL